MEHKNLRQPSSWLKGVRAGLVWTLAGAVLIALPIMLGQKLLPQRAQPQPVLAKQPAAQSAPKPAVKVQRSSKGKLAFKSPVARVFKARLPAHIAETKIVREKKRLFLETLVPIVLRANEQLDAQRRYIIALSKTGRLTARQLSDLQQIEQIYRVTPKADGRNAAYFDRLLTRIDIVPPSLAITQAAIESGWGTSRFARQGNALFGEWTWDANASGMAPRDRDAGKVHRIKTFDQLLDSVASYMTNLNRHPAYAEFRQMRAKLRNSGAPLAGRDLAKSLISYSERGYQYVEDVVQIMDYNRFALLDQLVLEQEG